MKDRGKDKAMAQTERRRGRRGEGKRRGEKETERQREDTVWGGCQGCRENARPQFTVLGQAGLGLGLVSIKREIESEKEKSYFFTLNSEK